MILDEKPSKDSGGVKKCYIQARDLWRCFPWGGISLFVEWADGHNGIITAIATLVIALLTVSLVEDSRRQAETAAGQIKIMQGQLNEMRDEQRAWVGPTSGVVEPPRVGAGIKSTISYSNYGKSPTRYSDSSVYRMFTRDEWDNGVAVDAIKNYEKACMTANALPENADIFFPSNGNNSKTIVMDTADARNAKKFIADYAVINGDTIFVAMGCFIYLVDEKIRHTTFCYFFDAKTTKAPGLNICATGPDAD